MRIQKELQLAINLISKLNDTPKSCADLSKELNASLDSVQKIACRLRRAELCSALRGFGGGLFKRRSVRASEIVNAIQKQSQAHGHAAEVQDQLKFLLNNIWL